MTVSPAVSGCVSVVTSSDINVLTLGASFEMGEDRRFRSLESAWGPGGL